MQAREIEVIEAIEANETIADASLHRRRILIAMFPAKAEAVAVAVASPLSQL